MRLTGLREMAIETKEIPFSYQIYVLRDDGEMDKFSSPEKDTMTELAQKYSPKYSIVDTIKEEHRTVYIARGSVE